MQLFHNAVHHRRVLHTLRDCEQQNTDNPSPTIQIFWVSGHLASTDDFCVLGSGLVVQETTNAMYNESLLGTITPSSALTWARSVIANHVSLSGQDWVSAFPLHNSGTINNHNTILNNHLINSISEAVIVDPVVQVWYP